MEVLYIDLKFHPWNNPTGSLEKARVVSEKGSIAGSLRMETGRNRDVPDRFSGREVFL